MRVLRRGCARDCRFTKTCFAFVNGDPYFFAEVDDRLGDNCLERGASKRCEPVKFPAFEHQHIGSFRRFGRRQQWCVAGAKVSTEDNARTVVVHFNIGGPEDVASPLQPYGHQVFGGVDELVPLVVGQRHQAFFDGFQVAIYKLFFPADPKLEGIFQHMVSAYR